MEEVKSLKTKKSRIYWRILFVFLVLLAIVCAGVISYHIVLNEMMNDIYEQARVVETYADDYVPETDEKGNASALPKDSVKISINFELLRATGKHVYAWIEVPGTNTAYPIVQHPTNNNYYVRRAISGSYDVSGCIYTENLNSTDFQDKNTAIYGHYMYDGSKFGFLLKYSDKEYFDSHREIVIYTETHKYTYRVFAALPFNTRHVLSSYRFCEDPFAQFLYDVYATTDKRAVIAEDVEIDVERDRIITLSTCMKTRSRRFLVLAVLTRTQICD